jgi:hypothetical protein
MAINKTYLRQMRACRRLARWADRHPLLLDALVTAEATASILYVFMYC